MNKHLSEFERSEIEVQCSLIYCLYGITKIIRRVPNTTIIKLSLKLFLILKPVKIFYYILSNLKKNHARNWNFTPKNTNYSNIKC